MHHHLPKLTHQLHPLPHNPHHRPRLHHLIPPTTKPILHLRQPIHPRNHRLRRRLQLRQLLRDRGNDVRQRETLVRFQSVDEGEAGGDVGGLEEGVDDEGDVGGLGGGDAFVDCGGGDFVADDLGFFGDGLAFDV